MVILGLGTNQTDRLGHLRKALRLIKKIPGVTVKQVSPVYSSDALLTPDAPPEWNLPYLNLALRCETTLQPEALLLQTKKIESDMGRISVGRWGPRIIDIDILAWGELIKYDERLHIPHKNLHERPFALWPLADVAPRWIYPFPGEFQGKTATEISRQWGSRFSGSAPLHTRQISHRIDTPEMMGILNITPNSFSDGGNFIAVEKALQQAQYLFESGAEIIDIGAEATGPNATPITPEEEWQRLQPILTELIRQSSRPKISIDTRHPQTALQALNLGADWINDVSGLTNPLMRKVIKEHPCHAIFMHHLQIPEDRSQFLPLNEDPVSLVHAWAKNKITQLEAEGFVRESLIFDIGIGYGKTTEQSLELLKNISVFNDLGVRLLVGHSRKSFLQQFTSHPPQDRDLETLICSLHLADCQVDYLRVHDILLHNRAFNVAKALVRA